MDPGVIQGKEAFFRSLDALVLNTDNFTSGKDAMAAMKNLADVQKHTHDANFSAIYDTARLDAMVKFMSAAPAHFTTTEGMKVLGEVTRALVGPPGESGILLKKILPKTLGDTNLDGFIKAAASSTDKDYSVLVSTLNNMNVTVQRDDVSTDQRNLSLQRMVNSLAELDTSKKPMDTEAIWTVQETLGLLLRDKEQGLGVMTTLLQQGKTEMDVLPDGRVVFKGDNAEEFSKKFGNKINTALKAYANASGMSTKEAAPGFYKEYLSPFIAAPAAPVVAPVAAPVGPVSKDDLVGARETAAKKYNEIVKARDSGKISKEQFSEQASNIRNWYEQTTGQKLLAGVSNADLGLN